MLARECPSPYSLASWQLHHTERCWCSTPAAACTERRALRCHWVGTARCRCVPALADDHATPCWLLQPHASNESSASRPAACPPRGRRTRARSQSPAARVARSARRMRPGPTAPPARGPRHGNGNRQGLRRGAPPARACSSQAELTHPSPSRPKRRPAVVGSCVGEHQ